MNAIAHHIEYLLQHHVCVVLPGLGALVVREIHARYDEPSHTFWPPRRQVSFNPALTGDDALLTTSVARARGISPNLAAQIVEDSMEAIKRQLAHDGSVTVGRVGVLSGDPAGQLAFQPFEDSVVSPSLRWLRPLDITTVEQRGRVRPVQVTADISRDLATVAARQRRHRRIAVAAAAAAIVATTASVIGVVGIPQLSSGNVKTASVAPMPVRTAVKTSFGGPTVLHLRNHADAVTVADTVVSAPAPVVIQAFAGNEAYCLIVASLASEDDAQKFIGQHPGLGLQLLNQNGRFRVYAAAGNTAAETLAAGRSTGMLERFPSAWVCRR